MADLKEDTASEYLNLILGEAPPLPEATTLQVPLELPVVPYDLSVETGPRSEDPSRLGSVEANPRANPALPSFALSALGRGAPESLRAEMSTPPVSGTNFRTRFGREFGPHVDMSSADIGIGPLHFFGSRGTRGEGLPPGETPPEQTTLGVSSRGDLPRGLGSIQGSYEKTSYKSPTDGPRFTSEQYRARWGTSPQAPIGADLEATATFPKFGSYKLPPRYNIGARATAENPFGAGGRFSGGVSANLRPGEDDFGFGVRYTTPLPFGGRR